MAKEKASKQKKSSKGILLPLIFGLVFLFASWYYWPEFLTSFMKWYLPNFHSPINAMFVLVIYLFAVLLAAFVMTRLFKSFYLFLGTFLPIAIYLGYSEWTAHEKTLKYLNANELLLTLFAIFESGHGK
jgi:ABC-type multidrug transport system permease subunit